MKQDMLGFQTCGGGGGRSLERSRTVLWQVHDRRQTSAVPEITQGLSLSLSFSSISLSLAFSLPVRVIKQDILGFQTCGEGGARSLE